MKRTIRHLSLVSMSLIAIVAVREHSQLQNVGMPNDGRMRLVASYAELPLSFEANQGQADASVEFLSRGSGYALFLTANEAVLMLGKDATMLQMKLLGANPAPSITGVGELSGKSNYFIGDDPEQWRTNVPNYSKVQLAGVYPGVDLVYYGNQRELEYDFVVAPGAAPSAISLAFEGAQRLVIDDRGDLALETSAGEVRWRKPVVYQEVGDVRRMVDGRYVRKGKDAVGFEVASYDPRHVLVIDPILDYSTFFGGNAYDAANDIAVDSAGRAYVVGYTYSTNVNLATPGSFQSSIGGGTYDAFVAKFDPAQSAPNTLVYCTYLGGSGGESATSIAVDALGNAYVAGVTGSVSPTPFPTINAYQSTYGGGFARTDAFVSKLSAAGDALLYSTYLGGSADDIGFGIAVEPSNPPTGYAYVTGAAYSTNFPTRNGLGISGPGGFMAKLNTTLAGDPSLLSSTYLDVDTGNGIAVDSSGNAYVAGDVTCHPDGGWIGPPSCNGMDAFVLMIDTDHPSGVLIRLYARALGGYGTADSGQDVALDSASPPHVYIIGYTSSYDFDEASSSWIQSQNKGGEDAFVAMLNVTPDDPNDPPTVYSTYLGGTGDDRGLSIAVDSDGNAYVTGSTFSADFHRRDEFQFNRMGNSDAFVAKIGPFGPGLFYSSYLGGDGPGFTEAGWGVAVDSSGNAYVAGDTGSSNFPTVDAFQPSYGGGHDAFVTKIVGLPEPSAVSTMSVGALLIGLLATREKRD